MGIPIPHEDSPLASMRPRHKAAENPERPLYAFVMTGKASMRPRHKAAENRSSLVEQLRLLDELQ